MTARRLATIFAALFGLQALRAFFPLLLYVVKDRYGLSSIALGEIAIAVFATGFLAPLVARRAGGALSTFSALLVARGALQLWQGDPAISLVLAAAGVVTFLTFLATPGPERGRDFLVGALLDVAVHATCGTRDLHWRGSVPTFTAGALVGTSILVALRCRKEPLPPARAPRLGLFAWGPFLFLQLELLGNVARLSARTALPTSLSGAAVASGLALAAIAGPRLARARLAAGPALPLLAAAFLVPPLLRAESTGIGAIPLLWTAQLAAALLLIRALDAFDDDTPRRGVGGAVAAMGTGSLLLIVLLFLHYARYDLPIPLDRTAGKLTAAAALLVAASGRREGRREEAFRLPLAAACAGLALLPLARGVPASAPPARNEAGTVVVTFNLHAGFDERGGWAFDRMLRELKQQRPDVVALQEVSRGWVINGCADLYELSRERLGLTGTPAPSVTTDWGSAVFVRGGIAGVSTSPLPPPQLAPSRAVTVVERPKEAGMPHRVVATHLHHRTGEDAIRDLQARAIATSFPGTSDAVLLGDFNAVPGSECFSILQAAGWSDAAGLPGVGPPASTYPAAAPVRRIDTIFVGDPSRVVRCEAAPPWGSDHRAVIVQLAP